MTYKSIVENMIRQDACTWVEDLLKQNGIGYLFTSSQWDVKIDKDDVFLFTYEVHVKIRLSMSEDVTLIVGGAVDDVSGISHSCIWNARRKLIWMDEERSRKDMGIERFTI